MWLFLLLICLAHSEIVVRSPSNGEKSDPQIGKYLELKERESFHLECNGEFVHPHITVSKDAHSSRNQQERYQDRVEEHHSPRSHLKHLYIRSAKLLDTGTYSCVNYENSSNRDNIYLFVSSSSVFLNANETSSAVVTYSYQDGRLIVPCKTAKFVTADDVELYANDTVIKMANASENYDPRFGYNISEETIGSQPVHSVLLSCRYKKDSTQKMDYFFTNKTETSYSDSDYKLFWNNSINWPHVGLSYNLTCQLDHIGLEVFEPKYHQLDITCQNCADKYKIVKQTKGYGRISTTVIIPSLASKDSHKYICTWAQRGTGKKLIHHNLSVANTEFQVNFVTKSAEEQVREKDERFTIRATFEVYPLNRGDYTKTWIRRIGKENVILEHGKRGYTLMSKRQLNGSFTEFLYFHDTSRMENKIGEYKLVIKHPILDGEYSTMWNISNKDKGFDWSIIYKIAAAFTALTTVFAVLAYIRKSRIDHNTDRKATEQELKVIHDRIVKGAPTFNLFPTEVLGNRELKRTAMDQNYFISIESIKFGMKLGEGQFGTARKGVLKNHKGSHSKIDVAIKTNRNKKQKGEILMLEEEFRMLCSIKPHENVLRVYGVVLDELKTNGFMHIVAEFAENGDLRNFLMNNRANYKGNDVHGVFKSEDLFEFDLVKFCMQIANGMKHLTDFKCVHRDLACRNILTAQDKTIRIADFGLSKKYDKNYYYKQSHRNVPLPYAWLSIEVMKNMDQGKLIFTQQSDVWAFGICLFEIFSLGEDPYPGIFPERILSYLCSGKRNPQPEGCSQKIYDFMNMCWKEKPEDRPTFSMCLDFFRKALEEDYYSEEAITKYRSSERKVSRRKTSDKDATPEEQKRLLEEQ